MFGSVAANGLAIGAAFGAIPNSIAASLIRFATVSQVGRLVPTLAARKPLSSQIWPLGGGMFPAVKVIWRVPVTLKSIVSPSTNRSTTIVRTRAISAANVNTDRTPSGASIATSGGVGIYSLSQPRAEAYRPHQPHPRPLQRQNLMHHRRRAAREGREIRRTPRHRDSDRRPWPDAPSRPCPCGRRRARPSQCQLLRRPPSSASRWKISRSRPLLLGGQLGLQLLDPPQESSVIAILRLLQVVAGAFSELNERHRVGIVHAGELLDRIDLEVGQLFHGSPIDTRPRLERGPIRRSLLPRLEGGVLVEEAMHVALIDHRLIVEAFACAARLEPAEVDAGREQLLVAGRDGALGDAAAVARDLDVDIVDVVDDGAIGALDRLDKLPVVVSDLGTVALDLVEHSPRFELDEEVLVAFTPRHRCLQREG